MAKDLYYRVIKNKDRNRKLKQKHDLMMYITLFVVAALLIFVLSEIIRSNIIANRFQNFKLELKYDTMYALGKEQVKATVGDDTFDANAGEIYEIYVVITTAGMGKLQKELPEGEKLSIDYGNGSRIDIYKAEIKEEEKSRDYGIFIRYENQDGTVFMYDTDDADFGMIKGKLLQIKNRQEAQSQNHKIT